MVKDINKPQSLLKLKLVLAAFAFLLYANSLNNGYAVDDQNVTALSPLVQQGMGGLHEIFTTNYFSDDYSSFEYRPLVKATYALEYELWGENLFMSHLINVLLYAFVVAYTFGFIVKLFGNRFVTVAFVAMLIFAAHPIHTEVVDNLKSRDELLSFLFSIISMSFIVDYFKTGKLWTLLLALPVFVLALLSKISAVIFIPVALLSLYMIDTAKGISFKKLAIAGGSMAAVLAVYAMVALSMLDSLTRPIKYIENPFPYNSFMVHMASAVNSLGWYIKLLFFPYPLRFYYGFDQIPIVNFGYAGAFLSLVLHLGLLAYALYTIKKKSFWSYCILFYLIAIFPFSNILVSAPGIIAERFAFPASMAFCLALAYALQLLAQKAGMFKNKFLLGADMAPVVVCLLFVVPYGAYTFNRNYDWKDNLTLMQKDIKSLPKSAKGNYMYAFENRKAALNSTNAGDRNKYYTKALKHFGKAADILKDYGLAYYYQGLLQRYNFNNTAGAKANFQKAVNSDSLLYEAKYELALIESADNNIDKAISLQKSVLRLKADAYNSRFELVKLNCMKGDTAAAESYQKVLDTDSKGTYVQYMGRGFIYLAKKDTLGFIGNAEKALDKNPQDKPLALLLAGYFESKLDIERSNFFMKKAEKADSLNSILK